MAGNDNEAILRLRNEASLCLDDLVALVVNGSLSFDLRLFSTEIMELRPGFAFSLKQARALRDITQKTLKQYQAHAIDDNELMNYVTNARAILKGNEQMNGGNQMSVFKKILHGKEIKKQENLVRIEREYRDVCEQILACEAEKARCIENTRGCAPDSMTYRDNERAYNNANNKLKLLRKQEVSLSDTLDQTTRIRLMEEFNEKQKAIARMTAVAFGNQKDLDHMVAEVETNSAKIEQRLDGMRGFGNEVFDAPERKVTRDDSEFAASLAADERRSATMNMAGVEETVFQTTSAESTSEFGRLVNAHGNKE